MLNINDRSDAARSIFREATRAGITRESIGQWHNLARRAESQGNRAVELECLRHALSLHATWGSRHAVYAMDAGTLARIQSRISTLEG